MGVAILHPRDIFPRNNLAPPHQQNNPLPNRRRRSPPRHQAASSTPPPPPPFVPKGSKKKNLNHPNNIASSHVRILKRGEENIPDLADLKPNRQIGPDPEMISTPIRISGQKSMPALFYAGPVTSTSPPPSEVPLPAFFAKKTVSMFKPADATNDLIRILRLDIA